MVRSPMYFRILFISTVIFLITVSPCVWLSIDHLIHASPYDYHIIFFSDLLLPYSLMSGSVFVCCQVDLVDIMLILSISAYDFVFPVVNSMIIRYIVFNISWWNLSPGECDQNQKGRHLEFKLNLTRLIDEKHALLYPNRESLRCNKPEFCLIRSSDSHLAMDTLGFGCILPTAGQIGDFHPLEHVPTGHTMKKQGHENVLV